MKFDTILEHQKIDGELIKLEAEVSKGKERSALVAAKAKLEAATETVGKLSQEAADLLAGYNKLSARAAELKSRLDEFDGILDGVADANEADYYIRQIESIEDEIASLEKDAAKDSDRIDAVTAEYERTWKQGIKASEAYKVALAAYNAATSEVKPRVTELQKKLAELRGKIPAEFMEAYLSLRAAKKTPAFVVYDPKSGTCGRCFMEVSGATRSKLKNPGDYAECPNCRRILYIPE